MARWGCYKSFAQISHSLEASNTKANPVLAACPCRDMGHHLGEANTMAAKQPPTAPRASTLCHGASLIRRMTALKTVRCVFICFYVMRPTRHGRTQKLRAPRWCGQKLWSAWKPVCPPNSKCRPLFILKSLNHAIFTVHNKRTSFLMIFHHATCTLRWIESGMINNRIICKVNESESAAFALRWQRSQASRWTLVNSEWRRDSLRELFETRHCRDPNHGHIVCTVDMEDDTGIIWPSWRAIKKAIV